LTSAGEFHRQVKRITGREVREAAAEVEPATGSVVHAFTTGTMLQIFLLAPSAAARSPPAERPQEPH